MKIVWGHWVPRFGSKYTATNLVPKWHQILQVRNGGIGVSMPQHPNFYPCSCKIGGSKDLWQRKNDAGTLWSEIFWGCMGPPVWEVAAIGFQGRIQGWLALNWFARLTHLLKKEPWNTQTGRWKQPERRAWSDSLFRIEFRRILSDVFLLW